MSWLDDVPVGNDDQNPYDPNQPIEREFVLAPAWRALKANVSAIFKRSSRREEEYSANAQPSLTSRISEPEPHPTQRVDEPKLNESATNYQLAIEEVPSPQSEPMTATPFEPEPVL